MPNRANEEDLKQLVKNRWSYEKLVMDNDSATNQPIGAVSFHTLMRGEKLPTIPRQEHSGEAVPGA